MVKMIRQRLDLDQPYCRRCGATVTATAWKHTERFMTRCACGSCDVVFPDSNVNNKEND
jgi:ribosomal protein S27AE